MVTVSQEGMKETARCLLVYSRSSFLQKRKKEKPQVFDGDIAFQLKYSFTNSISGQCALAIKLQPMGDTKFCV